MEQGSNLLAIFTIDEKIVMHASAFVCNISYQYFDFTELALCDISLTNIFQIVHNGINLIITEKVIG